MQSGKHTILLVQFTPEMRTRTFLDFETLTMAMDGVLSLFEQKLRQLNPHIQQITYDLTQLHQYIDSLTDISALVYEPQINAYIPYNREWIKNRALLHLRKVAGH
eukprot:TRINITY_DN1344_c0_g1_i2.p1 TRINITY_DN1344_c0_g1~~TRINITY_DN1344_c0_g1_i2.p1  ORF type:complete len:114 (-),score=37.88 TRINITY_DN1344_c0_g1_i2:74-388(-)